MNGFVDLHCHMLCGVDDGAADEQEMFAMLDLAYKDGTRHICLTPHANSYFAKQEGGSEDEAFAKLEAYAEKYSDLTLYRGNELFFSHGVLPALKDSRYRSMNGTRYVLVEFAPDISFYDFSFGLHQLAGAGYIPLVAHVERYSALYKRQKQLLGLVEDTGAALQVNASSLFGKWGFFAKRFAWKLVRCGAVAAISSDGHGAEHRPPMLSRAYHAVEKSMGKEAAQELFYGMPLAILKGYTLFDG